MLLTSGARKEGERGKGPAAPPPPPPKKKNFQKQKKQKILLDLFFSLNQPKSTTEIG
jgi:hypothetical protein